MKPEETKWWNEVLDSLGEEFFMLDLSYLSYLDACFNSEVMRYSYHDEGDNDEGEDDDTLTFI